MLCRLSQKTVQVVLYTEVDSISIFRCQGYFCDSPEWHEWHSFSSSNVKDTSGPISASHTTELTAIEAMALVLGQHPGRQLLLQRRASRSLQGIQSSLRSPSLLPDKLERDVTPGLAWRQAHTPGVSMHR